MRVIIGYCEDCNTVFVADTFMRSIDEIYWGQEVFYLAGAINFNYLNYLNNKSIEDIIINFKDLPKYDKHRNCISTKRLICVDNAERLVIDAGFTWFTLVDINMYEDWKTRYLWYTWESEDSDMYKQAHKEIEFFMQKYMISMYSRWVALGETDINKFNKLIWDNKKITDGIKILLTKYRDVLESSSDFIIGYEKRSNKIITIKTSDLGKQGNKLFYFAIVCKSPNIVETLYAGKCLQTHRENTTLQINIAYLLDTSALNTYQNDRILDNKLSILCMHSFSKSKEYGVRSKFCRFLEHVSLPDETTHIKDYSFYDCVELVEVRANNIKTIGIAAFYNCNALKYINLSKVRFFVDNAKSKVGAFQVCMNLENVDMPLIKVLPIATFKGCMELKTVNIPNVEVIEDNAFYDCDSLITVNCPKLCKVGIKAFAGCFDLQKLFMHNLEVLFSTKFEIFNKPRVFDFSNIEEDSKARVYFMEMYEETEDVIVLRLYKADMDCEI